MSVLYLVLPLVLIMVGAAIAGFVWAARTGAFDDLTSPALRALHEDDTEPPP